MRHRKHGRKLGRTSAHRQAMLRNLVCSLFHTAADPNDDTPRRVTTTIPKAKEARRLAERCITLGKRALNDPDKTLHARRRAIRLLQNTRTVRILFDHIVPLYNDREGGYTRILRLAANRLGDGADLCYFELVTEPVEARGPKPEPVAPKRAAAPPPQPDEPEENTHGQESGPAPDHDGQPPPQDDDQDEPET